MTTRTLNPLPFHDLEPHRFEDLIRQLAYDLRRWKQIEPTGRGGADDGMDIRAIELVMHEDADEEDRGEEPDTTPAAERLWLFQCKREKEIGPTALREIIAASLPAGQAQPHGFILAAACDFSKRSHDAFRAEMVARHINEFYLWGRSALEDMLFQPKNDHLLFVYFNISLQLKRRTARTRLRSILAVKRQIKAALARDGYKNSNIVLLRDSNDTSYPATTGREQAGRHPSWVLCEVLETDEPGGLLVLRHQYLARISPDRKRWDAILERDFAQFHADNAVNMTGGLDLDERAAFLLEFWQEYAADEDRAYLKIAGTIPFERILAIDPDGDSRHRVPHIFVDFNADDGPFGAVSYKFFDDYNRDGRFFNAPEAVEGNREAFFPVPVPRELFPPPEEFRFSQEGAVVSLSSTTKDGFRQMLAESASLHTLSGTADKDHDYDSRTRLERFRTWRDGVLVPVLRAFVEMLENEGHQARISIRHVGLDAGSAVASESVELRMRLSSTHSLSEYGRARISFCVASYTRDGWVEVRQSPKPQVSVSESRIETLTDERIQAEVLALLKRTI